MEIPGKLLLICNFSIFFYTRYAYFCWFYIFPGLYIFGGACYLYFIYFYFSFCPWIYTKYIPKEASKIDLLNITPKRMVDALKKNTQIHIKRYFSLKANEGKVGKFSTNLYIIRRLN